MPCARTAPTAGYHFALRVEYRLCRQLEPSMHAAMFPLEVTEHDTVRAYPQSAEASRCKQLRVNEAQPVIMLGGFVWHTLTP